MDVDGTRQQEREIAHGTNILSFKGLARNKVHYASIFFSENKVLALQGVHVDLDASLQRFGDGKHAGYLD